VKKNGTAIAQANVAPPASDANPNAPREWPNTIIAAAKNRSDVSGSSRSRSRDESADCAPSSGGLVAVSLTGGASSRTAWERLINFLCGELCAFTPFAGGAPKGQG
jgi:hypothetical protein